MNYDIAEALRKMEEELIQSMKRNLQRHLKEEDAEGFDWAQWQAEKLNSIARYRAQNRHIIGGYISTIPQQIEDMIRQSYETGKQQEEIRILKAIRQGYLAAAGTAGEIGTDFFTVNERKLNALVKATQGEMHKAVSSILRYQDDIYRQTIFRSAAQFNMGGKSLGQAVDAAVQDFLAQGIRNIRYKDGRYVNIASYAEMALRTANLRANIQGEAAKRDEWGVCTVKLSAHGSACPKCIPWQGKVYYDDVYGSVPVPKDGKYPLLSTAIAGGALHPNCKNGVHTWFEGINQPPKEMTQEEIDEANRRYDLEQQQRYCERNVRKYKRLKLGAIDPENAAKYAAQEQAWRKRLNSLVKENKDVLRMDYRRLKVYDAPAPPEPKDNGGSGKTYSPEKIGGKSLTSGADSGIIKDIESSIKVQTKYFNQNLKYYSIIPERIENVPKIKISGLTEQENDFLRESCKALLKYMQSSELGTEGVIVLNSEFKEIDRYKGASGSPSIPLKQYEQPHIVIHNHPDGLPFSEADIQQFIRQEKMMGLGAIGNDGTPYFIYKTPDYDVDFFEDYVNNIRMNHLIEMTAEDHIRFSEEVLDNAIENGVTVFNGKNKTTD